MSYSNAALSSYDDRSVYYPFEKQVQLNPNGQGEAEQETGADDQEESEVSNQPQDAVSTSNFDPFHQIVDQINEEIAAQGSNSKNHLIDSLMF